MIASAMNELPECVGSSPHMGSHLFIPGLNYHYRSFAPPPAALLAILTISLHAPIYAAGKYARELCH